MEEKINQISRLLRILSWKKIIQITVFVAVIVIAYGLWDNRLIIYNNLRIGIAVEVDYPVVFSLSSKTSTMIDNANYKTRYLIGGIHVVSVNFRKNTRSTVYFSATNEILKEAFISSLAIKISDSPLFTDNEFNNQNIVNLINNEFDCNEMKDVNINKALAKSVSATPYVCSISVPPYYGRFTGFMTIYLVKKPTSEDIAIVKQIARDLSLLIFEQDINKVDSLLSKRIRNDREHTIWQ